MCYDKWMQKISLPKKWQDYLLKQPESGQGYQRVDILFDDGTLRKDCVVFQSRDVEIPKIYKPDQIRDMWWITNV